MSLTARAFLQMPWTGHQEAWGTLAPQGGPREGGPWRRGSSLMPLQGGLARTAARNSLEAASSYLAIPHLLPPRQQPSQSPSQRYSFATHIFGIKYSFLTSPSKVTGKLTNSQLEGWRSVKKKKKFLGFEIKMCGCAYEILTVKTTYHPLQSFSQRQMKACT